MATAAGVINLSKTTGVLLGWWPLLHGNGTSVHAPGSTAVWGPGARVAPGGTGALLYEQARLTVPFFPELNTADISLSILLQVNDPVTRSGNLISRGGYNSNDTEGQRSANGESGPSG